MIWTMGEMIVEIMRDKVDQPLDKAGVFLGPYPAALPLSSSTPLPASDKRQVSSAE